MSGQDTRRRDGCYIFMYFQVPFTLSSLCEKERGSDQNVNKVKIGKKKELSHWKYHSVPSVASLSRCAGMIQRGGLIGAHKAVKRKS